jgi:RNA polymerase sigma-70 factor (ECF subfamily)
LVFPERQPEDRPSPEPDGHALLEAKEIAAWIDHALARLPTIQRQVLILCCIENLPQQEVGEILGLNVNTVKTHLRRGRMALAQALALRGYAREEGS